jgi:ATP-dependent RNA helicase RhlE
LATGIGFTRTKHGANRLATQLETDGISAAAIHGNKSQGARTKALADFKSGTVRVLVATDIAARGIDIHKLPHVVNYELPNSAEDYVHRIGRTARAGQTGGAISLVCVDELKLLSDIEKLIGTKIEQVKLPGYDVDPTIKPEPIQNGRAGRGNGRQGVDRQPEGKRSGTQGRGAKSPGQKQGRSRNGRGRAA